MAGRSHYPKRRLAAGLSAAVAALCLAAPCFASPRAPLSRAAGGAALDGLGPPLLMLFLSLAIAALLVTALLKRSHRSPLLAACLALSIVLHMLSLSLFSVLRVRGSALDAQPAARPYRVALGLPSVRESLVSQSVRTKPLDMGQTDRRLLETDRAAAKEAVETTTPKTPAPPEPAAAKMPGPADIKTPDLAQTRKEIDEPLQKIPDRAPDAMTPDVAARDKAQPAAPVQAQKPDTGEKPFDLPARDQAAAKLPEVKSETPRASLKDADRLPVRNQIVAAAAANRQQELKEAIQPAEPKPTIDRLDLAAKGAPTAAQPAQGATASKLEPAADIQLARVAAETPAAPAAKSAPTAKPASPRMSANSLADARVEPLASRPRDDIGGIAPDVKPGADLTQPLRLAGGRMPLAPVGADAPVRTAMPATPMNVALHRGKSELAGTDAAGVRPRVEVREPGQAEDQTLIQAANDQFARPQGQPSSIQDQIAAATVPRAAMGVLGNPAPRMAMLQTEQKGTAPAAGQGTPTDVTAGKADTALGSVEQPTTRLSAKAATRQRNVGGTFGTLVEAAPGQLSRTDSPAAAMQEGLASSAGGASSAALPLTDVGAAASALESSGSATPSGAPAGAAPAALEPARARTRGMQAEAGAVGRPSAGLSSGMPAFHDSFMGRGAALVNPHQSSPAVGDGGQIGAAVTLVPGSGDLRIMAGRPDAGVAATHAPGLPTGELRGGSAGQSELVVPRAERADAMEASAGRGMGHGQAPGGGAGGVRVEPSGTLVDTASGAVGPAGVAAASAAVSGEPVAVAYAGGSSEVLPLSLAAPTVGRSAAAGGETGRGGAGARPAGQPLQVAKAGRAATLEAGAGGSGGSRQAGSLATGAGAADRGPSQMDVEVSLSDGPPRARGAAADISATGAAEGPYRSALAVGAAPQPDSVPEKAIYGMRKPAKRKQFIKELGGTAETEAAVEQALAWLSHSQSDDGRWDIDGFKGLRECGGAGDLADEDVAVTALALLSYLGAGYTHIDGAHQETVRKGLDWLLSHEKDDGDIRGPGQMYGQAMATIALCESYSLTGDERLLLPARRAVEFIVNAQTAEAGWRYAPRTDSDTSVTGWQILALKSARIAGIQVPEQTFKWTGMWLDKVRSGSEGGLYAYKPGHAVTEVMTAEGWFCQLFLGEQARTRGQAESIACVMQRLPAWDPEARSVHLYYWYYATLSLYLSGAKEFDAWNAALTKALLQGRRKTGPAAGSWDPICQLGPRGGRIYSTAAAALCLEVYYRFMPFYKQK